MSIGHDDRSTAPASRAASRTLAARLRRCGLRGRSPRRRRRRRRPATKKVPSTPVGGGGVDLDHLAGVELDPHGREAVLGGAAEHDGLVADGGVLRGDGAGAGELLAVLVQERAAVALDVPLGVDPPVDAVDRALGEGDGGLLERLVVLAEHRADHEAEDDDDREQHEGDEAAGARPRRGRRRGGGGWPWLGGEGSNLQQPAPKAGVLPVELPPIGLVPGYASTSRTLRRRPVRTMARA